MGYLYLNFIDNLNNGSKNWDDFYTLSLNEQYEALKPKLESDTTLVPEDLRRFINFCFSANEKQVYYISMPCFTREMKANRRGKDCIYNIVIRPERNSIIESCVPRQYDVILIGDLVYDTVVNVAIKGIELIDSIIGVYSKYNSSPKSVFTCVHIMDKYLLKSKKY